jgi:lysophospholipase L1-like esterase
MPTNAIFIIFIIALAIASAILLVLVFYVLRLIKISTKLKAKQFTKFNASASPNQIVFLGDSLTDFYQVEEFFHDYKIYNRGIASDTTKGVLERLQTNVIDIKPSKVFLQIGTNDYLGHKNEYIYNNIIRIVETLKAEIEGVKVYVISLYPVNHKKKIYSRFFTSVRKNKTIVELNKKLKEYCTNNGITYIDVHSHLIDAKGNLDKKYTVEGLHMSYEGYEVITEVLLPYVKE